MIVEQGGKTFRSFNFESFEDCMAFIDSFLNHTPEERQKFIVEQNISEGTLQVLFEIVQAETLRMNEIIAELQAEKDELERKKLEEALSVERMRIAKQFTQRDDREVMCPVGSGWPSHKDAGVRLPLPLPETK